MLKLRFRVAAEDNWAAMASPRPPARNPSMVAEAGETLAAALRRMMPERSWSQVRGLCASGKVLVDGMRVVEAARRLRGGESVSLSFNAPRPESSTARVSILFEDAHLVVIDKPEDVASVPYARLDKGTAIDLIRAAWKRRGRRPTATPLYTVHRLDKDTSGVMCFGKTKLAERGLHRIFKRHLADREYVAAVHGTIVPQTFESCLVADRGDGIRGSTRLRERGQLAITHVIATEPVGGQWPAALAPTLIRVRLKTGRTHQIRIHLAEAGHPLIGETVYIRDFRKHGQKPIECSRLLLHARTLGFEHPVTGESLRFESPLPASFEAALDRLRRAHE